MVTIAFGKFEISIENEIEDTGIEVIGGERGIHINFQDQGMCQYRLDLGFDGRLKVYKHGTGKLLLDIGLEEMEG